MWDTDAENKLSRSMALQPQGTGEEEGGHRKLQYWYYDAPRIRISLTRFTVSMCKIAMYDPSAVLGLLAQLHKRVFSVSGGVIFDFFSVLWKRV